jgi:DNA polymerase I-like protein with 3'-5' exonuclease and polymerase domains
MNYFVFDIETNALYLDEVDKIHCLSYYNLNENGKNNIRSITKKEDILKFFEKENSYFIGHNIIRYDIPVLEKLLCKKLKIKIIDTLGLSWYLYPNRIKSHGLEKWGEEFKVKKIEIDDWSNKSISDYILRCEIDVKINTLLFKYLMSYLNKLYNNRTLNIIKYINFKLDCLKEQEISGIPLNIKHCKNNFIDLNNRYEDKRYILSKEMCNYYGEVFEFKNIFGEELNKIDKYNPDSTKQIKKWLEELGWIPTFYKTSKSTKNKVPQIQTPKGICPNILKLNNKKINELDSFYKIRSVKNFFEKLLKFERNKRVYATAHGFTNTMRLKHSHPLVNIPKKDRFFGEQIRSSLYIGNENNIMCGSDLSSIEDKTKRHYIFEYDPEYVNDMEKEDFDPHIDIGILAGLITKEESEIYKKKEDKKLCEEIGNKRHMAKTVNFCATYNGGKKTIASTAGIDMETASKLHDTFWKRNHAIKEVCKNSKKKFVNNQRWLYNPTSKFWMFLKNEKDTFSTLNQSTAVYVFDLWLNYTRSMLNEKDIKVCYQCHDELLIVSNKSNKNVIENILKKAIEKVQEKIKLNVKIGIDINFGKNYCECH